MVRWLIAGLLSMSLAGVAFAKDKHRELGAHEHGQGTFNIAIEGKKVSMELESPGADIVGFEHKAKTKKQRAAVSKAKKTLKKVSNVVALPAAAGCKLEKASVELHIEGEDDHHGHSHGHSHGHKKKAKAKHDHDHHKHSKNEAKESTHSEFHVEYQLTCADPQKLVEITFPYFKNFKGAEELEVSIAGPKSQKKFEVGRGDKGINLGGVI